MSDEPSPEPSPNAGPEANSGASPPPGTTAIYIAKRLVVDRGFAPAIAPEAKPLAEACDFVLTRSDGLSFEMACFIDRERDPARTFSLAEGAVVAVGEACLRYTGRMGSSQMPVTVKIFVVGPPLPEAEQERLRALARAPGFELVGISLWFLDPSRATVQSSAFLNGLFSGRRYLEALLREPRLSDAEMRKPRAVVGTTAGHPVVTYVMIGLLVVAFVVELVAGLGPTQGLLGPHLLTLAALGGLNGPIVLEGGEWHRLLTAAFLHGDLMHLGLNAFALFLAGAVLESLVGRAWLLALFFLGAVGGSLLALVVNPANVISVGASGAIMGMLAAGLVSSFRLPEGPLRLQIQMPILQILVPSLIPLATHRAGGRVDFAAHLGGAVVGALLGLLLLKTWRREEALPRFRPFARGVALAGVVATAVSLVLVGGHYGEYARIPVADPVAPGKH